MFALDQNIWGSGITLETMLRLYNTCILPIFLYGSEIWCLTSTPGGRWMHWIIGDSDASSISIGLILSPMMWFGHVRDNRSCQILSVNGACPSLVICAVLKPVKTTPELSRPAFGVLPKTGDEELEDRGRPGWERLRMICARSTLTWRRQDGALWIDRHGVYCTCGCGYVLVTCSRERERVSTW